MAADSIEVEVHHRLYYVLDQLMNTIPEAMNGHPMTRMLSTFVKEGKKDLRRIPGPYIEALSKQVGEAFLWVAEGSMSDIETGGNEPG